MTARLAGLSIAFACLLAGSQSLADDWLNFGDTRSAIEYSSLLSGWSIDPKTNRITFETKWPLVAVFVPTSPRRFLVRAELWKDNSAEELHSWDFVATPDKVSYPFLKISPSTRTDRPFTFTEPGDYRLRFWAKDPIAPAGVYITQLDFQVEFLDLPERAKPLAVLTGPWDAWAYLWCPYGERESGRPQVRIWRRADLKTPPEGDQYAVKIVKNGVLVGMSEPKIVTDFEPVRLDFPLTLPENLGGGQLVGRDLLAQVGEYHVLVEKNGQPQGGYFFEVELLNQLFVTQLSSKPAFKFHENQTPLESPLQDYIVRRMPSDKVTRDGAGDTVWMERMSSVQAALVFRQIDPAAKVPDPMTTPLVKPGVVTEPIKPAVEPPREVASLTPKDEGKLPTIPLPTESTSKPNVTVAKPDVSTPKPDVSVPKPEEASSKPEPATKTVETARPEEPARRPSRESSDEEPTVALEPAPKPLSIWESHLGLIASIFAAHIAVGVFCSYKILKAA